MSTAVIFYPSPKTCKKTDSQSLWVKVYNAGIVCYLPLLVDELLWTFTAQTVHQLSVIPYVTAYKFAQLCGSPSRFGWRDRCPGGVGDPALKNGPGKGVSAARR